MKLLIKNIIFLTLMVVVVSFSSCSKKNPNLSFMGATLGEQLIVDSLKLDGIEMNPQGYYGVDAKPVLRGTAKIENITIFPIETLIYTFPEDSVVNKIEWYTENKIDASSIFDLLCSKYGDVDNQKDSKYSSDQIHEKIYSFKDRYYSNITSARIHATQAAMNNSYSSYPSIHDTDMFEEYAEWNLSDGNVIQFFGIAGKFGADVPRFVVRYTNNFIDIEHSKKIQKQQRQEENAATENRKNQLEKMGNSASSADF